MSQNPDQPQPLSRTAEWLFAALFWLAGIFLIALAMDWVHAPKENFHAPHWVVGVAGLMFFAAGFAPMIARQGKDTWASRLLALVIIATLAAISNWVAFGPGTRQFSGGSAVGALAAAAPVSESAGRIAFGFGALLLDVMLIWFLVRLIRGKRDR